MKFVNFNRFTAAYWFFGIAFVVASLWSTSSPQCRLICYLLSIGFLVTQESSSDVPFSRGRWALIAVVSAQATFAAFRLLETIPPSAIGHWIHISVVAN
jgi:hypothetical protein